MRSPANNTTTAPPFCDPGMSMTMHMDGFHSTLYSYLFPPPPPPTGSTQTLPCLNFLLRNWTLGTPAKFVAAMVGVTILGIAAEGMAAARSGGMVHKWARRLAGMCCCLCGSNGGRQTPTKLQRHLFRLFILTTHVLQALIGYVLMLSAMTYSLELMGCALLGLGIGYAAFFELDGDYDGEGDGGGGYGSGVFGGGYDGDGGSGDGPRIDGYEEIADRADDNGGTAIATTDTGTRRSAPEGAATCCDLGGGRGPPRRAFQFLRSPVPTIDGIGVGNRRIVRSGGGGGDGMENIGSSNDGGEAGNNGNDNLTGADNLSLHEDDKMTPLL